MAKILVVDDESLIRRLIKEQLTNAEHNVFLADNGRSGLKTMEAENPDLIITDIVMPDMEGLEFIIKLRKIKKNVPVIAMSGNAVGMDNLDTAEAFGANEVIVKPFDMDVLAELVENSLQRCSE